MAILTLPIYTLEWSNINNALPSLLIEEISSLKLKVSGGSVSPGSAFTKVEFASILADGSILRGSSDYTGSLIEFNIGLIKKVWPQIAYPSLKKILSFSIWIYDSSGDQKYSSMNTQEILPYNPIEVTEFNVSRNLTISTSADFRLKFQASNINNQNIVSYKKQYLNGLSWIDIDSAPVVTTYSFDSVITHSLPYLEAETYKLRVIISDLFSSVIIQDKFSTADIPMSWGNKGIGLGKVYERGALDIGGEVWKNDILQPTIYMKKPTDPNPDNMEDGDILIVFNDMEAFSSTNFPQEFGTGYVWGQTGTWPTLYAYWTSMSSSSNSIIESFECSAFKGDGYPTLIFDGIKSTDPYAYANGFFIPLESVPVTIIFKFKGKVQFNSFALNGWGQDHEIKNSPKSFVFFGSNDGHTWDTLYDTTSFEDSWKTTKIANMLNSGNYYEYLKMVFRANQDDNAGVNGSMIAIGELSFNCSGYKYV